MDIPRSTLGSTAIMPLHVASTDCGSHYRLPALGANSGKLLSYGTSGEVSVTIAR